MKKLLIILFLFIFAISIAGCGPMTPQDQMAWSQFWQNYSDVYQRELDRQAYGRRPVFSSPKQSNYAPNFWQEQVAIQQWQENLRKKQQPKRKYNPYTTGYYQRLLQERKFPPLSGGYYR